MYTFSSSGGPFAWVLTSYWSQAEWQWLGLTSAPAGACQKPRSALTKTLHDLEQESALSRTEWKTVTSQRQARHAHSRLNSSATVRIFRVTQLQSRNTEVNHPGPEAQVCLRQSRPLLYWTSGADHTLSFKY